MMKNETPRKTATPVMMLMKCSISRAIGVLPTSSPLARFAIRPMTVRSPVAITIPRHVPAIIISITIRAMTVRSPVAITIPRHVPAIIITITIRAMTVRSPVAITILRHVPAIIITLTIRPMTVRSRSPSRDMYLQ